MCEPLRGKKKDFRKLYGFDEHIFMKSDVKSAVEFYKKYENDPLAFMDDRGEDFKDFMEDVLGWIKGTEKSIYPDELYLNNECRGVFNSWLFHYCFGDVIND